MTKAELADAVGLSASTCLTRVKRLERAVLAVLRNESNDVGT